MHIKDTLAAVYAALTAADELARIAQRGKEETDPFFIVRMEQAAETLKKVQRARAALNGEA